MTMPICCTDGTHRADAGLQPISLEQKLHHVEEGPGALGWSWATAELIIGKQGLLEREAHTGKTPEGRSATFRVQGLGFRGAQNMFVLLQVHHDFL